MPAERPGTLGARRQIWAALQPMAAAHRLDPLFVYAMVKLESDFDPRATQGEARGLLQIKPSVWRSVTRLPYDSLVWNERTNLAVGIAKMASLKKVLTEKGVFSYPMLWATYHYGLDFTAGHGFDMSLVPRPSDPVSYLLWSGAVHPIRPPE